MPDLLFEIGTEEIPAGYIQPALAQLSELFRSALEAQRLSLGELKVTGTPRRLVLWASAIPQNQAAALEEVLGPPARIAFDADGKPTKAALGFAKKNGIAPEDLQVKDTPRGDYICAIKEIPGRPTRDVLQEILTACVRGIVFRKSMYWRQRGTTFARPVRSILALFGTEVIPVEVAGVRAGKLTHGHPFLAPGTVQIDTPDLELYKRALAECFVIVDAAERRAVIRKQIETILGPHNAALKEEDEELLDEVTNLVEHPFAVEGRFEEDFLSVPSDIIVEVMKKHQRYFPIITANGRLQPAFVAVTNRTTEQADVVREGNERVLRARLEDARFFWNDEQGKDFDGLVERLKDVSFLGGLGSNYDRAVRIESEAAAIAGRMGLDAETAALARRAGRVAKADLVTGLVGEFPGLQGVIGREIALFQNAPRALALAIAEHYRPRFANDALPETDAGIAVSLADKLDVSVGCFSLDLVPSGSQDPYALRRNAQGILRILGEKGLDLSLTELLGLTLDAYDIRDDARRQELIDKVLGFFRDRLTQFALDRGFGHDVIRAVMASGFDSLPDFWLRLEEIRKCSAEDWWPVLVELIERTWRIHKGQGLADEVDPALLTEPAERALWKIYEAERADVLALADKRDYFGLSRLFADRFGQPVHRFFDEVFVNVDDEAVKKNRLTLCNNVNLLYTQRVANLAIIGQT